MNQKYVLKHNEDIEKLVKKKNSIGNKYYAIYFDTNDGDFKVAISVSKKCGSSPARNYEKRVVREIIRAYGVEKLNNITCLLIIKKESIKLNYDEKKLEITQLLNKLVKKVNI